MSEDKRVLKTKRGLKQALVSLLEQKEFQKISVTELCNTAETSRITFYCHYDDKYDLADDLFKDMVELGYSRYHQMQLHNNVANDPIISYGNLLDCMLDIYYNHQYFFKHVIPETNSYLAFSYYKHVMGIVESHVIKTQDSITPKYDIKKIVGFLCYGLCGFINESHATADSLEQIKQETNQILTDILAAEILTTNK